MLVTPYDTRNLYPHEHFGMVTLQLASENPSPKPSKADPSFVLAELRAHVLTVCLLSPSAFTAAMALLSPLAQLCCSRLVSMIQASRIHSRSYPCLIPMRLCARESSACVSEDATPYHRDQLPCTWSFRNSLLDLTELCRIPIILISGVNANERLPRPGLL